MDVHQILLARKLKAIEESKAKESKPEPKPAIKRKPKVESK